MLRRNGSTRTKMQPQPLGLAPRTIADETRSIWGEFQLQQMRDCVHTGPRLELLVLLAFAGAFAVSIKTGTDGNKTLQWLAFVTVALVLFERLKTLAKESLNDAAVEKRYCIMHNSLQMTAFFAVFCWTFIQIPNELVAHKGYVSHFLILQVYATHQNYLPIQWHIVFVSIPSSISWICFHMCLGHLDLGTGVWAIIWPSAGVAYHTMLENREWIRYQAARKEHELRELSETWEKALRGMLSSVFDAFCEVDEDGVVVEASPHFEELIGKCADSVVGRQLQDVTTGEAEADRVTEFIQARRKHGVVTDDASTAARMETSFRNHALGLEVSLSLSCVALPCECGVRFLIGCQKTQGENTSSWDAEWTENMPHNLAVQDIVDIPRAVEYMRSAGEVDSESLLSYSLTVPSRIPERTCINSSTQTDARQQLGHDASTQTSVPSVITPRPPLPRQMRKRCVVSFKSAKSLYKDFRATPSHTIKFMLQESVISKITPAGRGCCAQHMCLATLSYCLKDMDTDECSRIHKKFNDFWQCPSCFAINENDEDLSEDAQECQVCGDSQQFGGEDALQSGEDGSQSGNGSAHERCSSDEGDADDTCT